MKLSDLANALGCQLIGDGDVEITGVEGMEQASPSELTFLANPKYAHKAKHTQAAAILVTEPVRDATVFSLISKNPYLDFARALEFFYQPPRPAPGIHPLACVAASAEIGENASIGPFVSVGARVHIGRNAILHPHVVIYEGAEIGDDFLAHSHAAVREFCRIGNRVTLQNGVVVGGDGFGFAKRADGSHHKIVQSGVTVIEDDVKLDNQIQIGHNVRIGAHTAIAGCVGISGSTTIGARCMIGGMAGIAGHLEICDGVAVLGLSMVSRSITTPLLAEGCVTSR